MNGSNYALITSVTINCLRILIKYMYTDTSVIRLQYVFYSIYIHLGFLIIKTNFSFLGDKINAIKI